MSAPKVIAVVGPTASGKTELGIQLVRALGGEIISADSRQVYRGLDIGTGKVTRAESRVAPHHLLDIASPKRQVSADEFVRRAQRVITKIVKKHRTPIVVGGTGFYIDALLGRLTLPHVPPNPALRAKLASWTPAKLFAKLKKMDPERAATIELHHPRRLIRAIEIAQALGKSPKPASTDKYEVLWLGLYPGEKKLRENIHERLEARLRRGIIAEALRLHRRGLSYRRMRVLGLQYRFLADYLQGMLTKAQMTTDLERAIHQYAKRQMRWFRRNASIHWVGSAAEARALAEAFVRGEGAGRR